MATTTEIETIIDNISSKLLNRIISLQETTQMEDEYFANVVAGTISSSVDGAIKIIEVLKKNELVDAQIAESESSVAIKETQSEKDILVKTQQIAESKASVAIKEAQSEEDILVKTQQIAESEARVIREDEQSVAKISLTTRQEVALDDAKNVKKAELLGNTISLIESGGSTAPAATWTTFNGAVADI